MSRSNDQQHKELFTAKVKRDYDDFRKIQTWFKDHNPFDAGTQLVVLDSGLTDDKNVVTCDKSGQVRATIQKELDGKAFTNCPMKRKNQIVTLQSLHSSVNIGKETVTINPLKLFMRLVVVAERNPESKTADYFSYELCPLSNVIIQGWYHGLCTKVKAEVFLTGRCPNRTATLIH